VQYGLIRRIATIRERIENEPVIGGDRAGAQAACAASRSGKIFAVLIATEAAVRGGATNKRYFVSDLRSRDALPAPLFVALGGGGADEGPIAKTSLFTISGRLFSPADNQHLTRSYWDCITFHAGGRDPSLSRSVRAIVDSEPRTVRVSDARLRGRG